MAWPFSGNSGGNKNADQNLSEERLKILANVAIEQVPFPEQGMLTEEDAWTISPGPTRARINSQQSVPNVAASLAPAPTPVPAAPATVDTSGLERLISSRLDMVEDVLRMVEHRLEEGVPVTTETSGDGEGIDGEASDDADAATGDRIITASGEVVEVGGTSRMMKTTRVNWLSCTRLKPWQPTRSSSPLVRAGPATSPVQVRPRSLRCSLTTCPAWPP